MREESEREVERKGREGGSYVREGIDASLTVGSQPFYFCLVVLHGVAAKVDLVP